MKYKKNELIIKKVLIEYIKKYSKEYILVILIFIIGLFAGVLFVNTSQGEFEEIISNYITEFIQKFKNIEKIDNQIIGTDLLKNNFILAISLWIAGTTIIGMPVVLGIILYRGFCLGYTISAITITLGRKSGILFCLSGLFLQNVFFIPALLSIGVSSINLYKSIIKDRRKENIKLEIIRHTIISILMLVVLIISCLIENKVSVYLLQFVIRKL